MALEDVKPLSTYTYESVLPRLGYVQRTDDETGATNWYNLTPDEGTGRVRFEEGSPADPGLQYAPQGLYEKDLRSQGYVPTDPYSLSYYAQFGQYGEGKGFGGDVRSYLDYVYGPGTTVTQDPTHGLLIKPADPARALEGGGTPVALPNRSGSFGDFLKEGALTIAPLAAMAFAGPLAQMLGSSLGLSATAANVASAAILGGAKAELAGGDFVEGAIKAGATAGIGNQVAGTGVAQAVGGALNEIGIPENISNVVGKGIEKAGAVGLSAAVTGGDVPTAVLNSAIGSIAKTSAEAAKYGISQLDSGNGYSDAEAQEGGFYGIPAGYEGLGYTPQEVSQLIAGTYSGPEQTEAQVRDQLGDQYDIAYGEGFPTYEGPAPIETAPVEGGGQSTGTAEKAAPSTLERVIDTIPFAGIAQAALGTSGGAKTPSGTQQAGAAAPSGLGTIPWLDTSADILKNVPVGYTGENAVSGLSLASGGSTSCCSSLYAICKYVPKFACSKEEMLPTTASSKRSPAALQKLKQLQASISPLGNMGGMASGGLPAKYREASPDGHNPEFVTGLTGFYADGRGTGQSDDIPALLHDGDYVMDAETVAQLGDGSSKAGRQVLDGFRSKIPHRNAAGGRVVPAKIADGEYVFPAAFVTALGGGDNKRGAQILDGLREKLRAHKRSAPTNKIPPKAKSPLDYIKDVKG